MHARQQSAHFVDLTCAILDDDSVTADRTRDFGRALLQNLVLGTRRVVSTRTTDRCEQLRTAPVVEELGWHRLRGPTEPCRHFALERLDTGRQIQHEQVTRIVTADGTS